MSHDLLAFFTLEASEYVESLDGLLARASGGAPDGEGFVRNARALRGAATMAKAGGIADVAAALERVARALHGGQVSWDASLRGAVVAAVDDLKILIRGVRNWGATETAKSAARASELAAFAPAAGGAGAAAPNATSFLAAECAELATRLQEFADNPVGPAAFATTLQRVRGLRGIAVLKDLPPLPEIVDALDTAAKAFELGGAVTPALRSLFFTSAQVLADGSVALQRGDRPATSSPALAAFANAASAFGGGPTLGEEIVPIASLFGATGGLVEASATPPTTSAQRFRLEVVSQAEHLRRLVSDAARAVDSATRERLGRELGGAAHALSRMSASFGEDALAGFFGDQRVQAALLGRSSLDALDRACQMLASPHGASTADIVAAVARGAASRATPMSTPVISTPTVETGAPTPPRVSTPATLPDIATFAPTPPPEPAMPAAATVPIESLAPADEPSLVHAGIVPDPHRSGDALSSMLEQGIAGLSALDEAPLAEPAPLEDVIVPIEDLVYRGHDALDRAIEIRDALKRSAGAPDPDLLAELYDLLELAATAD